MVDLNDISPEVNKKITENFDLVGRNIRKSSINEKVNKNCSISTKFTNNRKSALKNKNTIFKSVTNKLSSIIPSFIMNKKEKENVSLKCKEDISEDVYFTNQNK